MWARFWFMSGGAPVFVSFGATIVTGSRRVIIACRKDFLVLSLSKFQVRASFITGSNERNLTYVPSCYVSNFRRMTPNSFRKLFVSIGAILCISSNEHVYQVRCEVTCKLSKARAGIYKQRHIFNNVFLEATTIMGSRRREGSTIVY